MLTVGVVPFLVGKPLVQGLDQNPDIQLVEDSPANLGAKLREGLVDTALASSVFALGNAPLPFWTEGPLVACDGPARSVLILMRPGLSSPAAIQTLHLDPTSRTGRELALIVLAENYGSRPVLQETPSGENPFDAGTDAIQIIGDAALLSRRKIDQGWTILDLGEEWKKLTQLPFVFAGWLGRPGFDPSGIGDIFNDALEQGLAARHHLAKVAANDLNVPEGEIQRYLFDDMKFRLPPGKAVEALRTFDQLRPVPVT
ncbi:MAG TPA: hypothetical protein DDW23_05790 [Planctomycetes bacterium]|nr:hypothetical protein [Planctomycetota bacterium]